MGVFYPTFCVRHHSPRQHQAFEFFNPVEERWNKIHCLLLPAYIQRKQEILHFYCVKNVLGFTAIKALRGDVIAKQNTDGKLRSRTPPS